MMHYPRKYLDECRGRSGQKRSNLGVLDLLRFYPKWRSALRPERNSLADESPWIGFAVIQRLQRFLKPDMKVFEWGSGGSTLFFAARAAEVVSVEHDSQWHAQVLAIIEKRGYSKCNLNLVEPGNEPLKCHDDSSPDCYCSSDIAYAGKSFKDYASLIDRFANHYFDVILIDGRARPSCFKHALTKIKPGGLLVWDNTERQSYWPAMKSLGPTSRNDFVGPCPYLSEFTTTTIWQP